MNKFQKSACYNLILIAWIPVLTVLVTLMSVKFFGKTFSLELATRNFCICTLGILVVMGTMPRNISLGKHMKKEDGEILFDERDQFINSRAILAAYFSLCIFFLASLIISLAIVEDVRLVPFYIVPIIIGGISITILLVYSIAVLVQYNWRK